MSWVHTTAASAFNVCCVSIDLFFSIRFPFKYHDILTKRRCLAVIIFVCFISLRLTFFNIFLSTRKGSKRAFYVVCMYSICSFIYWWSSFDDIHVQIRQKIIQENFVQENFRSCKPNSIGNIRLRAMQNFKVIETISFVSGACIITWMPSLVLLLIRFYYINAKAEVE